jgi:hypothetical protein
LLVGVESVLLYSTTARRDLPHDGMHDTSADLASRPSGPNEANDNHRKFDKRPLLPHSSSVPTKGLDHK